MIETLRCIPHFLFLSLALTSIAGGAIILLLGALVSLAFFSARQSRRQIRRFMLLADASNEYIYEYDIARDRLTLTAKCSALLQIPQVVNNCVRQGGYALPEGLDITTGTSREITLGDTGVYRVVSSLIQDKRGRTEYVIGKLINISEEKEQLRALILKSETDGLTGLCNAETTRRQIQSRYEARNGGNGALFIIDVDRFKYINDTYGHYVGDRVLVGLAIALRETFRESDVVGRVGGDEFCVYMSGNLTESIVRERCETLRARVSGTAQEDALVTLSMGVLVCDDPALSFRCAYQRADAILYAVKRAGRNGYTIESCS